MLACRLECAAAAAAATQQVCSPPLHAAGGQHQLLQQGMGRCYPAKASWQVCWPLHALPPSALLHCRRLSSMCGDMEQPFCRLPWRCAWCRRGRSPPRSSRRPCIGSLHCEQPTAANDAGASWWRSGAHGSRHRQGRMEAVPALSAVHSLVVRAKQVCHTKGGVHPDPRGGGGVLGGHHCFGWVGRRGGNLNGIWHGAAPRRAMHRLHGIWCPGMGCAI